ncbi:hypothetical protein FIBSPDRAFT_911421 [Athelia psychrophila]|uniref:VPS9 domain-containing protein n=1 Tax=Athelia psychrophila TaxID=1759441 RepID=A0A166HYR4_9AGAM|nr:hypothetical protein FIBSPDRAFT_911421 [Fibularhizoctonia sp. CBS 109695]
MRRVIDHVRSLRQERLFAVKATLTASAALPCGEAHHSPIPSPALVQSAAHNLMDPTAQPTSALANLHLSGGQPASTSELNPWQDVIASSSGATQPSLHVHAPNPPEPAKQDHELLDEFDPLVDRDELAAREAWARAPSHPPPAPIPIPQPDDPASDTSHEPPPPPSKDAPAPHPAPAPPSAEPPRRESGSGFPSFAALARTFSIPSISRPRPVSIDTAKPVPSPSALSALANLKTQDAAPPPHDPETSSAVEGPSTPAGRSEGGAAASPRPGRDKEPQFDFQQFLDQMKMKNAEPVAKYLRSFLGNYAKRTFTVGDQVKIINDFLNFIAVKMRETDVWRTASDAEFDNAMEGMEKLVMNRLYEFTFTPQVARMSPPRPITADDLERDRVLSQRIALFGWIEEAHLDVPVGEGSKGFLMFGQTELLKINHYKAPRDKLICILNCCKVIFGLIRHLHKDEGADSFIPILIYIVLKANPDHLLSNVEFINRFRNPEKLQSEAGYYLSSLMGAVSFIETMDHTSLSNITQEQFEQNVENAIQALPHAEPAAPAPAPSLSERLLATSRPTTPVQSPRAGEESAQPLALATPAQSLGEDARRLLQKTGDTISKPLSAIGRIFTEAMEEAETQLNFKPQPPSPRMRRPSPNSNSNSMSMLPSPSTPFADTPTRAPGHVQPAIPPALSAMLPARGMSPRMQALAQPEFQPAAHHISRTPTPNLDLAGIQSEIDRAHDKAFGAAQDTLLQIFPGVDREVVEWVLEANQGDLGKSIEGLLEMSSG